jgi:23S rRNA pseudouridine2605 synthase
LRIVRKYIIKEKYRHCKRKLIDIGSMKKVQSRSPDGKADSLSKYIAQAGVASRRKVTELIKSGFIKVNGSVIKEPGYKITPTDRVTYNDKPVIMEEKIYIIINKPKNYITTVSDEKGRKTVMDLVSDAIGIRLYPVGRLDRNTTGLLILTNDGEFAQKLSHPKYEVQKVYAVTLDKLFTHKDMSAVKAGLLLEDGPIKVDAISYVPKMPRNHLQITLHSGKNRIVRRIFEFFGYEVIKLDRIAYAGLRKKGLKVGEWRYLTRDEFDIKR